MKTILTAVFALLVPVSALAANRCVSCQKRASLGKTLCASCASKKLNAERQARREAAVIAQKTAENAEGGTPVVNAVQNTARIESFCGYKFGETIPSVRGAKLTEKGNYVVFKKLDKPFRSCNKVCLTYTGKAHALYSIEVYSDPDPKLTEEAAEAEFKTIARILQEKYKDKMTVIHIGKTFTGSSLSNQLEGRCLKSKVNVKNKLKGSVGSVQEGWSYSIWMIDKEVEKSTLPAAAKPDTAGADVL